MQLSVALPFVRFSVQSVAVNVKVKVPKPIISPVVQVVPDKETVAEDEPELPLPLPLPPPLLIELSFVHERQRPANTSAVMMKISFLIFHTFLGTQIYLYLDILN